MQARPLLVPLCTVVIVIPIVGYASTTAATGLTVASR